MGHLLYIDNDALLKLARYGLLKEALVSLGCTESDVRVLPTARYSLMPHKDRLRRCKDEASAQRLANFLAAAGQLDLGSVDAAQLDELVASPGIDAGEAQLFAAAATQSDARIITGDKRALAALCSTPALASAVTALAGRIVAVETVFAMLTDADFSITQSRVRANPDVDKALTAIFGVSVSATLESVRAGLYSYESHLRATTGDLLYQYVSSSRARHTGP